MIQNAASVSFCSEQLSHGLFFRLLFQWGGVTCLKAMEAVLVQRHTDTSFPSQCDGKEASCSFTRSEHQDAWLWQCCDLSWAVKPLAYGAEQKDCRLQTCLVPVQLATGSSPFAGCITGALALRHFLDVAGLCRCNCISSQVGVWT